MAVVSVSCSLVVSCWQLLASNLVDDRVLVNLPWSHHTAGNSQSISSTVLGFHGKECKDETKLIPWEIGLVDRVGELLGFEAESSVLLVNCSLFSSQAVDFIIDWFSLLKSSLITSRQLGQSCQCRTGSLAGWWSTPTNARLGGGSPIFRILNDNTV